MNKGERWVEGDIHDPLKGSFELIVMFFGLTNSPVTFQTMIDRIL